MGYRFSAGDKVRVRTKRPEDKKRMPSYVAGKVGLVEAVRGRFSNPKDHADERPPLYSVSFELKVSKRAGTNDKVVVDLFEDWITIGSR